MALVVGANSHLLGNRTHTHTHTSISVGGFLCKHLFTFLSVLPNWVFSHLLSYFYSHWEVEHTEPWWSGTPPPHPHTHTQLLYLSCIIQQSGFMAGVRSQRFRGRYIIIIQSDQSRGKTIFPYGPVCSCESAVVRLKQTRKNFYHVNLVSCALSWTSHSKFCHLQTSPDSVEFIRHNSLLLNTLHNDCTWGKNQYTQK